MQYLTNLGALERQSAHVGDGYNYSLNLCFANSCKEDNLSPFNQCCMTK